MAGTIERAAAWRQHSAGERQRLLVDAYAEGLTETIEDQLRAVNLDAVILVALVPRDLGNRSRPWA
jgi:hypothetical protein